MIAYTAQISETKADKSLQSFVFILDDHDRDGTDWNNVL